MHDMQTSSKRNIGIDVLRTLAMFMICIIHVLGKGGVIGNTEAMSAHYYAAILLNIFVFCAVNCFAIISGYVGINAKYKYSNFAELWLRVLFYTVSITAVFAICMRGGGNSTQLA